MPVNRDSRLTPKRNRVTLHELFYLLSGIVWRNFSILSPKLVLAYAEDIFSDSRLKKLR